MTYSPRTALLACVVLAAACVGVVVAFDSAHSPRAETPTHVTAEFFDGVNTGNFVETCKVWRAAVGHLRECAGYLVARGAMFGLGDYRVVPGSYKGWREGSTHVASVKVKTGDGQTITARLVKTRKHGWLVVTVG